MMDETHKQKILIGDFNSKIRKPQTGVQNIMEPFSKGERNKWTEISKFCTGI